MLTGRWEKTFFVGALALATIVAGCEGDDENGLDSGPRDATDSGVVADGGTDTDGGMTNEDASTTQLVCPSGLIPIPSGGRHGGPIDGNVAIFVLGEDSAPLADATVVVSIGAYSATATTGADGCVYFEDAALNGAIRVDLYTTAAYTTNIGINAREITLRPIGAPPPLATVSGLLENLEVLGSTTATVAQFAQVDGFAPDVFTAPPMQAPRTGSMVSTNLAIVGGPNLNFSDYATTVYPGTAGMIAVGGLVRFPNLGQPMFTVSEFGFITGLDIAPGSTLNGQDISLTHIPDTTLDITIGDTLPGLPNFGAFAFILLPDRAGSAFITATQTVPANNQVMLPPIPSLTGAIADASYMIALQQTSNTEFSLELQAGAGAQTDFVFAQLPLPPSNVSVTNRVVTATLDASNTEAAGVFVLGAQGEPLWGCFVWDQSGTAVSIEVPVPPNGLEDRVVGTHNVVVRGYATDGIVDPDNVDFGVTNPNAHIVRTTGRTEMNLSF